MIKKRNMREALEWSGELENMIKKRNMKEALE
jgi:hypothetical protein